MLKYHARLLGNTSPPVTFLALVGFFIFVYVVGAYDDRPGCLPTLLDSACILSD